MSHDKIMYLGFGLVWLVMIVCTAIAIYKILKPISYE